MISHQLRRLDVKGRLVEPPGEVADMLGKDVHNMNARNTTGNVLTGLLDAASCNSVKLNAKPGCLLSDL